MFNMLYIQRFNNLEIRQPRNYNDNNMNNMNRSGNNINRLNKNIENYILH